jgi:hypothetical protein
MFLTEIFDQLTYGELGQINIGGATMGEIVSNNYPAMVSHLNAGLTRLHTRFDLKDGEVIIQQYETITDYVLRPAYTISTGTAPIKYIVDTVEKPFPNDLIKIEQVFDEQGKEIPLNKPSESTSMFTPAYDTLQIPVPNDDLATSLIYRARHAQISADNMDPDTTEINIPHTHMEALVYFMASRVFSSRGTTEYGNESAMHFARYEAACQTLEKYGMDNKAINEGSHFNRGGWS